MIPTEPDYGAISDPDLEKAVLAGATVNDGLARQAALVVTEGHFTTERARFHWRCIARCVEQGIDTNRISIRQAAKALQVDGTITLGYLAECDETIPFDITGYDSWLIKLDELRTRRRLIEQMKAVEVRVCDLQQPVADILETVGRIGTDIGDDLRGGTGFGTARDAVADAGGMDSFFDPAVASNAIGVGIPNVDDLYTGARPGQLVLVAGRTSMGKSAWLLQWAWNAAQAERTVWYYSLEMTRQDLTHRLCAHGADVNLGRIVTGRLDHPERQRITSLLEGDAQGRIQIADTQSVTTATMGVHLARAKAKPDLVIIDYLQLLRTNTRANLYERVSEISRSLKCLAVEHGVPIIAGSQLSRPETGKDDAAPRLSDLRDSGSLEQDADVVCFLHGKQADKLHPLRAVEYLVAKHRQGRLGKVALTFEGAKQRFFDPTDHTQTRQAALIHGDA